MPQSHKLLPVLEALLSLAPMELNVMCIQFSRRLQLKSIGVSQKSALGLFVLECTEGSLQNIIFLLFGYFVERHSQSLIH